MLYQAPYLWDSAVPRENILAPQLPPSTTLARCDCLCSFLHAPCQRAFCSPKTPGSPSLFFSAPSISSLQGPTEAMEVTEQNQMLTTWILTGDRKQEKTKVRGDGKLIPGVLTAGQSLLDPLSPEEKLTQSSPRLLV